MHIITDYITITAALYFCFAGWRKGFLRTLLEPIALVAGCLLGLGYYHKTGNIVTGLSISILSPFVINMLVALMLKLWHKSTRKYKPIPFSSRFLGGGLSLLWRGSYLALLLLLIGTAPISAKWYKCIHADVTASKLYTFVYSKVEHRLDQSFFDPNKTFTLIQNPEKFQKFESTKEFKNLMSDPQLKELLSDENITEQIKNKKYGQLLSNPKMQTALQDKELF